MVLSVILVLIGLKLVAELVLNSLNRAEVLRHAERAPAAVAAIMDDASYRKSVSYTLAKSQFAQVELIWDAILLIVVLTSGFLPWIYRVFTPVMVHGVWGQAAFLLGVGLLLSVPSLPLEWWGQFRLEERFGFNKSTMLLWISDKLKGLLLSLILGAPLLAALLALVGKIGPNWWMWGFALLFCFQLLMLVLEPRLIRPLFNKLTPLPDGELRERLMSLAQRTGFKASTIQVMDGSKRSAHSNAFFTGFGRFRRIVLYDTLINQLSVTELEAVLAHEVGHYKCGHIPKMLLVSALIQLTLFALIAWLMQAAWFNPSVGLPAGELAPTLLVFSLLSGPVMFWLTPLGNLVSRKHEYEADAFARRAMHSPAPLIAALHKLAEKNLSNLTPHRWFSGFYYSHPTLLEREQSLSTEG